MFLRESYNGIELLQAIGAVVDREGAVADELKPGAAFRD